MAKAATARLKQKPETLSQIFSAAEYHRRQDRLRGWLARHSLDGCFLTSAPAIRYFSGFDSSWRTAALCFIQRDGLLLLPEAEGQRALRQKLNLTVKFTTAEQPLLTSAQQFITGKRVAIEYDQVSMNARKILQDAFVGTELVDISDYLLALRSQKSPEEIAHLERLAAIAEKALKLGEKSALPGVTTLDLAQKMQKLMQQEIITHWPDEALGESLVLVQRGENSDSFLNPQKLEKINQGDLVSLTLMPEVAGYHVSLIRSLFAGKAPAQTQAQAYLAKANALLHQFSTLLEPGKTGAELTEKFKTLAEQDEVKLAEGFSFGHSLDIAAQRDDRRSLIELQSQAPEKLQENMVITLQLISPFPPETSKTSQTSQTSKQKTSEFFQAQCPYLITEDQARPLIGPESNKAKPPKKRR